MLVVCTCLVFTGVMLRQFQYAITESADVLIDGIFLVREVLYTQQWTITSVRERCL